MKVEDCVVNRFINSEEREDNDKHVAEFRTNFLSAREKGQVGLAKFLIETGSKYAVEPYTNFVQYSHNLAYFISKVENPEEQLECIQKIIELGEDKFEKTYYNTFLSVLNGIFNAIAVTSRNRLIILKKMIKICKDNGKEYLFAPYLLNIDDLLDISVYNLEEQLEIHEEFLDIIDNTIKKEDDFLLIMKYMELLNNATDELFNKKQDKLLKYIVKMVKDDKRLFDIESSLLQKCSQKVLENNKDLKNTFNTLISGNISDISDSYDKCKDLFKKHGKFFLKIFDFNNL